MNLEQRCQKIFQVETSKRFSAVRNKLVMLFLFLGIICFGFIFPDSFSDHNKMVHFAAHFGMSFLIASCLYAWCNIKLRMGRKKSYILLISVTMIVGILYKYLEIASQGLFKIYYFHDVLEATGCYTSMSQNISGLMAAILATKYFFEYHTVSLPATRQTHSLKN